MHINRNTTPSEPRAPKKIFNRFTRLVAVGSRENTMEGEAAGVQQRQEKAKRNNTHGDRVTQKGDSDV